MKYFVNNQKNCQVCKEGCIHIKTILPGTSYPRPQKRNGAKGMRGCGCPGVALGDPVESMFISDRTMAQCVAEKFALGRALWCLSHGRLRLIQESRSLRITVCMSVCLNMPSSQINFSGK